MIRFENVDRSSPAAQETALLIVDFIAMYGCGSLSNPKIAYIADKISAGLGDSSSACRAKRILLDVVRQRLRVGMPMDLDDGVW